MGVEPCGRIRSVAASKKAVFIGNGVPALRERLREMTSNGRWPLLEPVPVTRFLGKNFGVSNVSAYRVLAELAGQGLFWRAPNGRYFRAEARRLLERPAPVACLFRRLESWTQVSRLIMQGADDACGELERALLLVHDRALFRQSDPISPTTVGTDQELGRSLDDFLHLYGERTHGVLLDELWPDRVLAKFKGRLRHAVVLYRSTTLKSAGCVSVDVDVAADLVLKRAIARRYERLLVVLPFADYAPSQEMAAAIRAAGGPGRVLVECFHPQDRFQERLTSTLAKHGRVLVVATEDNTASQILDLIGSAERSLRRTPGLLSTMGTQVALARGITCVATDFRVMGEIATRMAIQGPLGTVRLAPLLVEGSSD